MTTFERLVKVFKAVFDEDINLDSIKPEADLRADVGMNSIGMLYMAMALEEEFEIKFTNEDFVSIAKVSDVIACIEGKL